MSEMNWEDVNKNSGGVERFKPEAGKTSRIKLMRSNPEVEFVQYLPDLGYFKTFSKVENVNGRLVITEDGIDVIKMNKQPMLMYVVPIAIYLDADRNGGLQKSKKSEIQFALWSFYGPDAAKLSPIYNEWGDLTKIDLIVKGVKRGRYINADINPSKDCGATWIKGMEKEYEATPFARDLSKFVARAVTEEEFLDAVSKAAEQDIKK